MIPLVGLMTSRRMPTEDPLLNIVDSGEGWLVVNKPADLVCHPTKEDARSSLIGRLRLHCGDAVRPVMVNRLDRETSGLVLVATAPETTRELGRLWEQRSVRKTYQAIVHGHPEPDRGMIHAPLGPDELSRVAIKDCVRPDGTPAATEYRVLRRWEHAGASFGLLEVAPLTGRKHQIRIHLQHVGHPVVGDKLYGGDEDLYLALVERRLTEAQRARLILRCHALHAWKLAFEWRGRTWAFEAPPSEEFQRFASHTST
jgi:23S rRNA pseudouridine1911/1915/1917 synthase